MREAVGSIMVPLFGGKWRSRRKRKSSPGLTGAQLEQALDSWAMRYPDRVS